MSDKKSADTGPRLSRREALARLGLGATAAYIAPVLLTLSSARASGSGGSGSSNGYYGKSSGGGSGYYGPHRRRRRRRHYSHDHGYPPVRAQYPHERRRGARILLPRIEIIIDP
jgi:hypothetical protein